MSRSEFQDPWRLIASGQTEQGLDQFREDFISSRSPFHKQRLGVAYLFVKQYAAAYDHFRSAITVSPATSASDYGMAGVAEWCLNKPSKAVQLWIDGLDAKYADAAGGIHIPLLLYYASLVDPSLYAREEATSLLKRRVTDRRASFWPGPLARHLLGSIDFASTKQQCLDAHRGHEHFCNWNLEFYTAIKNRGANGSSFSEQMHHIVTAPLKDPFDPKFFTMCIMCEEYYLARWELLT